jgi:BirA family transcriptional regulator, biotin operon repressor / biotin---[acetyl-CoA-carboxylase] ligase
MRGDSLCARVAPDLLLAPDRVAARGGELGRPMHLLFSTTSTNDEAKAAARAGAQHGSTWVADQQTAGRGRHGRAWLSPAGESLLFSVILRAASAPGRLPLVALAAGLAVRDAVATAVPGAEVKIKWPNDVYITGRKVAGILVEAMTVGVRVEAVVVGVGINVHTRVFPDELEGRATSVALVSRDHPPDRASILADVLGSLDRDLQLVLGRGLGLLRARLDAADALRGCRVRSGSGDEGVASGIDDEGRLLVTLAGGVVARWSSGEVDLVRAVERTSSA